MLWQFVLLQSKTSYPVSFFNTEDYTIRSSSFFPNSNNLLLLLYFVILFSIAVKVKTFKIIYFIRWQIDSSHESKCERVLTTY